MTTPSSPRKTTPKKSAPSAKGRSPVGASQPSAAKKVAAPATTAADAAVNSAQAEQLEGVSTLLRAVVDGLEDVKAQDLQVFDTEHLSSLFERVVVASGTSNRQTRALAQSVNDAVRDAGFAKPRLEGEENGEWIIVDCGAVVVHIMQPAIRQYYHLEDLWGEKPLATRKAAKAAKASKVEKTAKSSKKTKTDEGKKVGGKKAGSKKDSGKPESSATPKRKAGVGQEAAVAAKGVHPAPAKKVVAKKAAVKKVAAKKTVAP